MTLKDLLRDAGAEAQLAILSRADVLFGSRERMRGWRTEMALPGQTFQDRGGRYFGGQITDSEQLELQGVERPHRRGFRVRCDGSDGSKRDTRRSS